MFHSICVLLLLYCLTVPLEARNLRMLDRINPDNHELMDVEVSGDWMIISGGLGGSVVFNLSSAQEPREVASITAFGCSYGRVYAWEIYGNKAYAAGRECGLRIADFGSPDAITWIDAIDGNGYSFEDVSADENHLLIAAHGDGLLIWPRLDPGFEPIAQLSSVNAWAIESIPGHAYIADGEGGLLIVDTADPESPQLESRLELPGSARHLALRGNLLMLALGHAGIALVDVSQPDNPILIDTAETGNFAFRVAALEEAWAVANWSDQQIWLEEDGTLRKDGFKNTGGRVMAVGAKDNVVYSAEWTWLQVMEYGPIAEPDLDFSLRSHRFPNLEHSESDTLDVMAYNGGAQPYIFGTSIPPSPHFNLVAQPDDIFPGDSTLIQIRYTSDGSSAGGPFEFHGNDPDENPVSILVQGNLPGLELGQPAPPFELPIAANGEGNFELSDHRGEVVVVVFFADW